MTILSEVMNFLTRDILLYSKILRKRDPGKGNADAPSERNVKKI